MDHFKAAGNFIGSHMAFISPICVAAGIFFPQVFKPLAWMVPYLFAFITFQGSLNTTVKQLLRTFKHPGQLLSILVVTIVVMPVLARVIGGLVFSDQEIVTGIVIEYSIPIAVVSFMWVDIFHGNASLGLAAVLVSTILAPFTIPLTLQLLMGASVQVDTVSMMSDLLFMVAIPAAAGAAVNELSGGWGHAKLSPTISPICRFLILIVITCNATGLSTYVLSLDAIVVQCMIFILLFATGGFLLGVLLARLQHASLPDFYTTTFCVGLRNISSGSVIATEFFPGAAIIPVMMGTLFQQILAAIVGSILKHLMGEEHERQRQRLAFAWLRQRYHRH